MAHAALGPVLFDVRNDLSGYSITRASSFAKHDVLGSAPVYEDTGEEESVITLEGTMLPYLLGGMSGLALLEAARKAKVPLSLMRGDFTPLGWFLIQSIEQKHAELDQREGIGMEISYSVKLLACGNPGIGSAADILRLFL